MISKPKNKIKINISRIIELILIEMKKIIIMQNLMLIRRATETIKMIFNRNNKKIQI